MTRRRTSLLWRANQAPVAAITRSSPNCAATPASVVGRRRSSTERYGRLRSPASTATVIQFSCGGRAHEYWAEYAQKGA